MREFFGACGTNYLAKMKQKQTSKQMKTGNDLHFLEEY